ncbi:hypothetical protein [Gordonia sp. 852002-51296_SCH5728562-b]|uniref:hypothetical protein n=1 Tax=Gordonia sp. 852002-51296_SCH5728562-b TaxID=1834101 RepID=UPI0007EB20AC|nr:hypothetical protein [Gordonia sp. 852002-51296_SCH5728562-b]OBA30280.1 hypothetical protein A5766_15960 [Gordonia sp. 852002-51296_SCH5728562-b]
MAATSRPEGHRWGFYAAVMAVGLVLSMAGNGAHVWSQWHADVAAGIDRGAVSPWVPTVAITVVPAMVMVMTEMVVISHRRNGGWARTVVTSLAALVGVVALVVSYVGLCYVCTVIVGLPTALGYVAPVIVDAPIIAATVGLWDVQQTIRADRDLAGRTDAPYEPVEQGSPTVVDEVGRPVQVLDRPDEQVSEAGSTTSSGVDDRSAGQLDEQWSTRSELAGQVDEQAVDRWDEDLSDPFVRPDERVSDRGSDEVDEHSVAQVDQLDEEPDEPASIEPVDRPDEPVEWLSEAERLRAATGITAEAADLATVLRMDGAGASRREIAEAVGRPKSTISGWITKAAVAETGRPSLAAVPD